jgi:hypothetical protein
MSPEAKWQVWIAGVLAMTSFGLAVHIAIACGFVSFVPGFAQAGEIEKAKQELTAQVTAMESRVTAKTDSLAEAVKLQRISGLKSSLFDTRQKQCKAPSGAVRTLLTSQIKEMQDEYEGLVGREYTLPSCDSF